MWSLFLETESQAEIFESHWGVEGRLPRGGGIWTGPWRMVGLPQKKDIPGRGKKKKWKVKVKSLSRVWLFATPWTVAYQEPQSMGFSRQEYCSGLPFPSPGDRPDPGIEPGLPHRKTSPGFPQRKKAMAKWGRSLFLSRGGCSPWLDCRVGRGIAAGAPGEAGGANEPLESTNIRASVLPETPFFCGWACPWESVFLISFPGQWGASRGVTPTTLGFWKVIWGCNLDRRLTGGKGNRETKKR